MSCLGTDRITILYSICSQATHSFLKDKRYNHSLPHGMYFQKQICFRRMIEEGYSGEPSIITIMQNLHSWLDMVVLLHQNNHMYMDHILQGEQGDLIMPIYVHLLSKFAGICKNC